MNYDLHSTMYLLNPNYVQLYVVRIEFTFHYVSIKSCIQGYEPLSESIYIPLCIY